ncbi:MAG TPA: glycosyltransferase family 4 protein, partial [Sphingobacterium sp.]|nr:glycosyltransferase family 4 protein [Sphingobacterium sp.]
RSSDLFACKCGPRDLIEHGKNGFLVAPGDVDQLAENLQLVIAQESLRTSMSREALHKVKEFQPDFVMHKWIKLFESES